MEIHLASRADVGHLARLLWLFASPDERAEQSVESFSVDLAAWWTDHHDSHFAFIARTGHAEVVGMAWLALVPRVPRPGTRSRRSADVQSVFVVPEHRGKGIGSALVEEASQHAFQLKASRITVHSGDRSLPVYERLGFASAPHLLQREA